MESSTSTPKVNARLIQEAYMKRQPLRVLRAANPKSKYAPKKGVRYDGLYDIIDMEILKPATAFYSYSLWRQKDPHQEPSDIKVSKRGRYGRSLGQRRR